ncbi:ACP phosphodiesterase [Flavobacterium sp. '19STA2R22 D10 B1']|uniref:acyl carrier protein phosphodiesterase n=1 Tax=Flavobacterium aerium TaxID=3037261 RepID=UPI00278C214A|nr:ACP phosphodiesterase [Flavobacterium sp. '19STA2R22 D10 B1']
MNFLAHIYLSDNNPMVEIGNFMADGIRGKQLDQFDPEIQKGIILHRAIDTFTDAHPLFRQSTKRLHANYGHYSGVIIDVFYDHFLAKNWSNYSNIPLQNFAAKFYRTLDDHYPILTAKTQNLLPYMKQENWLYIYHTVDGLKHILTQMDSRTKNTSKMRFATTELVEFYDDFEKEFTEFFEELRAHTLEKFNTL